VQAPRCGTFSADTIVLSTGGCNDVFPLISGPPIRLPTQCFMSDSPHSSVTRSQPTFSAARTLVSLQRLFCPYY